MKVAEEAKTALGKVAEGSETLRTEEGVERPRQTTLVILTWSRIPLFDRGSLTCHSNGIYLVD